LNGPTQRSHLLLCAWLALSATIVWADYLVGPAVQFPIALLIPIILATWFNGLRWGLSLAILLALARICFRLLPGWNEPWGIFTSLSNVAIRIVVFSLLAVMTHRLAEQRRLLARRLDLILEMLPVGAWIADPNGQLVICNRAAETIFGGVRWVGLERYSEYRGWWVETGEPIASEEWPLARAVRYGESRVDDLIEIERFDGGERRTVRASAVPIRDSRGRNLGAVVIAADVTLQERAAREREELVAKLQQALDQVKTLSGLIPICAACKNIRNDEGYWIRLEAYLKQHSEADFTHSICPDCFERLYPKFAE
jgi:PAS domain-containing protein